MNFYVPKYVQDLELGDEKNIVCKLYFVAKPETVETQELNLKCS